MLDYVMAHGNPATDPVTYYGLKNQALDDPAGFQTVDLTNHMAKLEAKDYRDLQQLQASLQSGQPPVDLPLQQAYKVNTDRLLLQLGLPTGTDPSADADRQGLQQAVQLRQAVDLHVAANEIASGHKMTLADHQGLLREIAFKRQIQATSPSTSPNPAIAGTSSLGAASAWGARGAAAAEAAGEIATGTEVGAGGAALLSEGALATVAPLTALVAGILATTSTRTADPALDEYQAPLINGPSKTRSAAPSQILPRATPRDEEEDADCEDERKACTKLCLDALSNSKMKNIYSTHFLKCFKGCVPARCGGNPV
ncbi:MAG TPA: hypothetical protein VF920_06015 [Dongiaceae bacterium]